LRRVFLFSFCFLFSSAALLWDRIPQKQFTSISVITLDAMATATQIPLTEKVGTEIDSVSLYMPRNVDFSVGPALLAQPQTFTEDNLAVAGIIGGYANLAEGLTAKIGNRESDMSSRSLVMALQAITGRERGAPTEMEICWYADKNTSSHQIIKPRHIVANKPPPFHRMA
jgi:hypothetical protein